ncbi:MAG: transketolase C-terminal domain-containing protein, partial [Spirochaetota bacterium]|nr:transketolase C-terminal domain-containing protein [Spirochaetota bacterium]
AEQNLMGISAGMALEGFMPFPSTFAAFVARRALDQLAISICFPKLNVKIPGSYVGIPTSRAGASHNCIEDIAVMRSLPNLKVADPATPEDLKQVMRTAAVTPGPVYFRISRYSVPELFEQNHCYEWGRGLVLEQGNDVTLAGTGIMTHFCMQAAELLRADGIHAEVVHLASIKPIDEELLIASAKKTGCVVTAENATVIGGFGSAVTEVLAAKHPVPVRRIGVRDLFVESGGIDELFARHHMRPQDIACAAREVIQQRDQQPRKGSVTHD